MYQFHVIHWKHTPPFVEFPSHMHVPPPLNDINENIQRIALPKVMSIIMISLQNTIKQHSIKTNLNHEIHLLVHPLVSFLVRWSHSEQVYPKTITKLKYDENL